MSTRDVAEYVGVSERTVREWRFWGELEAVRAGHRTVRHRRGDVDAFLERRTLRYAAVDTAHREQSTRRTDR
jgi:excisionase family DNA binding protein